MADTDIVQVIAEARADAVSLSEFMYKPVNFMVQRRLAPPTNTLNFHIARLDDVVSSASVAINNLIANSGFIIVDSFELGATITQRNEALRKTSDGKLYKWNGNLPKVVPASSSPQTTGGFGENGWREVSDVALRQELASNKGIGLIGGLNITTPEQFGAVGDGINDDTTAVKAAFATGKDVFLTKNYGVIRQIETTKIGQRVFGLNRKTSGLKAVTGWTAALGNTVLVVAHDYVVLNDFTCDANDMGSAPSNRMNGLVIRNNSVGWSVTRVDACNATGYAHWAVGVEGNPLTSGVYYDCKAWNSQVLFEQLACGYVDLYSCTGISNSRCFEMFHPYGDNVKITYNNCNAYQEAGFESEGMAGVNIVTVNNRSFGEVIFNNCNVSVRGSGSAVNIVLMGDTTGSVTFNGGTYESTGGASVFAVGKLDIGVFAGAKFDGQGGFNCPAGHPTARVTIADSDIIAKRDVGSSAASLALITNDTDTTVTGGSLVAVGVNGSAAVRGVAVISATTRIFPAKASSIVTIAAEGMGVSNFSPDAQTNGYANIGLTANLPSDMSKFNLQLTLFKDGNITIPAHSLNWVKVDANLVRVWIHGMDVTGYKVSYRWAIVA